MLKRIYVDNFRSLVNFELNLEKVNLFMGGNGSGKSSVFDVLERVRRLVVHGENGSDVLQDETLTRWQSRLAQTIEVEVEIDSRLYTYRLEFLHDPILPMVQSEVLSRDHHEVFSRARESVTLHRGTPSTAIVDVDRSAVALLGKHIWEVGQFSKWFARLRIAALRPSSMSAWSETESRTPKPDFSDFASWYRYLTQSRGPEMEEARDALRGVMPGFYGLRLQDSGRSEAGRKLVTEWRQPDGKKITYTFDELSDGQRALIALYTLLYAGGDEPTTIAVDEPDNFVALSEIQPWLGALSERPSLQALLISHHPEILNMHALDAGIVFRRDNGGPTRVERFTADPGETLTPAELIARGWYGGAG